ncbi:MAG: Xaa-Pro peptidase family protein [Thaumarchaeota archaeon]|nr:Xaa-Pro peptidase family protein [Nitrososphaerota archaeon]
MTAQAVDSEKRVRKIFAQMDESNRESPEALILANGVEPHLDASFFYITGFPYGLFEGSFLLAKRDGKISLVTSPLEEPIAKIYAKGIDVLTASDSAEAKSTLGSLGSEIKSLALNSPELNYKSFLEIKSVFRNSKLIDASEAFESARLVKDEAEIESIQKACDIASGVYKKIPKMLSAGVTESTVAAKMAFEMQKAGGTGVSFDSIVAFGKNSAEPHYSAGQARLKTGQFVLCDYGTKFRRYCSDITRTLVFGKASKKQKRMYEIIRAALQLGTELCVPENTGEFVHSKVAAFIDSTEFKGRFIHSTGHSLGLSVHDGPGLSNRFKKKLKPGMVMTVEPGIYVPEFGGVRIEDDVLVTQDKPRVLTSAARELIEV